MNAPSDLLLPENAHLIHVGPHKTGSTAVQVGADAQRELLARHGVHYAGEGLRPKLAGWALGLRGVPVDKERPGAEHWDELVAEVSGAPGRVLISNEDFGRATPEQARRAVEELGGSSPHVVIVARRLDRYLPSQWQERVKAGDRRNFADWLAVVLADPYGKVSWDKADPGYRWERTNVLYAHDPLRQVQRWAEVVGEENVTLIVSDDSDRELLPRTFESLLGLPHGALRHDEGAAVGNASLSWAEAELVRDLNERLFERELPLATRRRLVHRGVVRHLRYSTSGGDRRRPPLPAWAHQLLVDFSRQRVQDLHALNVRVVGRLEDLQVPEDLRTAEGEANPQLPVETAGELAAFLLDEHLRVEQQRDAARSKADEARERAKRLRTELHATRAELEAVLNRPGVARRVVRRIRRLVGRA